MTGQENRPRLILVHGTRFEAAAWQSYAELIPEAEVVAVDLPGHGERAGSGFTMDMAVDVIAQAASGAQGRPVALAGHSLGGYVAATYAERNPHVLAALGLLGAMGDPQAHPVLIRLYTGFPRFVDRVGAERAAHLANRVMRRMGVDEQDLPSAEGYDVLDDAWGAVIEHCGPRQLEDLDIPVWLVTGTLDQLGIDLRDYRRAAKKPRTVKLRAATHIFPATHREDTARALADMVREIA